MLSLKHGVSNVFFLLGLSRFNDTFFQIPNLFISSSYTRHDNNMSSNKHSFMVSLRKGKKKKERERTASPVRVLMNALVCLSTSIMYINTTSKKSCSGPRNQKLEVNACCYIANQALFDHMVKLWSRVIKTSSGFLISRTCRHS